MRRTMTKLVHESGYAAEVEVEVEFIYDDDSWSPCLAPADIKKLEDVRLALRSGDIAAATANARVCKLTPLSVQT
jgi:hypothetical protein